MSYYSHIRCLGQGSSRFSFPWKFCTVTKLLEFLPPPPDATRKQKIPAISQSDGLGLCTLLFPPKKICFSVSAFFSSASLLLPSWFHLASKLLQSIFLLYSLYILSISPLIPSIFLLSSRPPQASSPSPLLHSSSAYPAINRIKPPDVHGNLLQLSSIAPPPALDLCCRLWLRLRLRLLLLSSSSPIMRAQTERIQTAFTN
jgi:hypothetical protein